ncbi:serine/threonine-protein phosphatase 2A regulatory subunit B'' subunit alpha-like [Protopterus annectens]|uniref:serine/threonine-protein phosphatase 2A regulatory subunit B'' subunit alpha-like n=1 Tax=Protopterus annectens TaxID=7888 RepID=UPI001CFBAC11|nr:serine/threonine-protein phosphatase 2A regulatory subunit B'' subunit alpha-like [Protopterus annectens]
MFKCVVHQTLQDFCTMAATYKLVVSTVNCYNSVVIDRRFQHTVHYCNGPCQAFRHGVECLAAHHSTCSQIFVPPGLFTAARSTTGAHETAPRISSVDTYAVVSGMANDDYHQSVPGLQRSKKGSTLQNSSSLKDITGEAINLASGKIKEFSFEKVKYTSNHVTLRKGRKVRPESFNRRSADLESIYGYFGNDENCPPNDENCPPLSLLHKSVTEEKSLSRSSSLEQNINALAAVSLQGFSEENLIAKILEKHTADISTSGEDIKVCLDILLKCSEDLKKCTDIIKQCIKKKSVDGKDDSSISPDVIYRNVMARLSLYLKKLPFEFSQAGHADQKDFSELVESLHRVMQTPFSPIFGSDQPPRYEDIIQSPPSLTNLPPTPSPLESEISSSSVKQATSNSHSNAKLVSISQQSAHQQKSVHSVNNSQSLPQLQPLNQSGSYSSADSLLTKSSDGMSKESMESLFIEEDSDVNKLLDKEHKGDGMFSTGFSELTGQSRRQDASKEIKKEHGSAGSNISENVVTSASPLNRISSPQTSSVAGKGYSLTAEDPETDMIRKRESTKSKDHEDIDRLLLDLESFSKNIESRLSEPFPKDNTTQQKDFTQQIGPQSHFPHPSVDHVPPSTQSRDLDTTGNKSEEDDKILLLRILESIESFAQELVDSGTGKGAISKEKEIMQILQDTIKTASQTYSAPERITDKDSAPSLSIQQTPEVIKVQNKQEKKPGTPPPAPVPSAVSPRPLSPPTPLNKVIVSAPISINIPRFYYPKGLPNCNANIEETIAKIESVFSEIEDKKADIYEMGKVAKACGCPLYWKAPMFNAAGGERTGYVSVHAFIATWRNLLQNYHDDASKFVHLLAKPGCHHLEPEDFIPLLQDVVDTHPGLTFLKDAPEFHSRYITTVGIHRKCICRFIGSIKGEIPFCNVTGIMSVHGVSCKEHIDLNESFKSSTFLPEGLFNIKCFVIIDSTPVHFFMLPNAKLCTLGTKTWDVALK